MSVDQRAERRALLPTSTVPISGPTRRSTRTEWLTLWVLAGFTLMAIAGYGVFALHPGLIPDSDGAREFFGQAFRIFARGHIILAALVLAIPLVLRTGTQWVPAFLGVFLLSFLSEFIGTGYGFPFSGYEYTSLLGLKLGGRVPLVIPVSWFLMSLPSWVLSSRLFPGVKGRLGRILYASFLLTVWDLALDPAMSHLTPYWVWEDPGPYYGMPWVNLLGWFGTGVVIMVFLEVSGAARWSRHLHLPWLASYYGLVLLMPLGMVAAAGLWTAWWTTLGTLFLPFALLKAYRLALQPVGKVTTAGETP